MLRSLAGAALLLAGLAVPTALTSGGAQGQSVSTRPNIVLITADDMSQDLLKYMPFTRRFFGAGGVRFDDALSMNPLCCPARAEILTGQHSHNNGVLTNHAPYGGNDAMRRVEDRALPVWLKDVGYHTAFAGKYVNGFGRDDTVPPGWSDWYAGVDGAGLYDYYNTRYMDGAGTITHRADEYQADVLHERAVAAVEQARQEQKPFFIWESHLAPHGACHHRPEGGCRWGDPMWAPQDDDRFLDLPLSTLGKPSFNERVVSDKPRNIRSLHSLRPGRVRVLTSFYRAKARSLQAVDRDVRKLVGVLTLEELAQTLFIFTSDNGYMLGEHRYKGKTLPYEHSLRVPLLIRGPGVEPGITTGATVGLVDIAATIADATDVQPMLQQDGRSLLGVASGEEPGYGAVAIETGHKETLEAGFFYQGVRTGRYTYVKYASGELELYDRKRDPHELNNVAYRPTYAATRAALQKKWERLHDCAGLACRTVAGAVPGPAPDPTPVHPDELASVGDARQLVTITARSRRTSKATAVAWRKRGRTWRVTAGPFPVSIGRHGLALPAVPRHGKGKTPVGTFEPASAIGARPDPGTQLRYRRLDANDYWSADPEAPRTYNVFQRNRSRRATWRQDEGVRWWSDRARFSYGILMDYNLPHRVHWSTRHRQREARRPADARLGSLVIHTDDRQPSRGWVSMPRSRTRWLLRWMRPSTLGTKFAVGTPGYLRRHL